MISKGRLEERIFQFEHLSPERRRNALMKEVEVFIRRLMMAV